MTIPTRLEQVLAKLDALALEEQNPGTEIARNSGVRFEGVLLVNHRFIRAKLRAAMEMEKALECFERWIGPLLLYNETDPVTGEDWRYAGKKLAGEQVFKGGHIAALAAWQQAGEEK